jgi:hypothetical protein
LLPVSAAGCRGRHCRFYGTPLPSLRLFRRPSGGH